MATNSEKFVEFLKDVSGGNQAVMDRFAKIAKDSGVSGLNSMTDDEYQSAVENFANGPLKDAVKKSLSSLDINKDEKMWNDVAAISQKVGKYTKGKFNRDEKTLQNFYGEDVDLSKLMEDENELKWQATQQVSSPEILKAEIKNALANKAEEEKKASEEKAEKEQARDKANEYRTGIKGSLLNDNSKDDFEQGNTAKGIASEILSKGATIADVGSAFMGPTPWGFGVAAVGPTLRLINNHVLHDSDKGVLDAVRSTALDYGASMGTQMISPAKMFSVGKGFTEAKIGSHMGDAFLEGAEQAIKNSSAKQTAKQAEKSLEVAKKAYERASKMKADAIKRGSKMTKAEKDAAKAYETAMKSNYESAKVAAKDAKNGEALASVMKKTGNNSSKNLVLGKSIVAAGKFGLKDAAAENTKNDKSVAERQADYIGTDATTIRTWQNGFKPHAGQELDLWEKWNKRYNNGK